MPPSCSYNSLESADRREITYSSPADLSQLLSIDRLGVKRTTQTTRVGKSFLTYAESVAKTTEASSSESQGQPYFTPTCVETRESRTVLTPPTFFTWNSGPLPLRVAAEVLTSSVSLFPRFDSPTLVSQIQSFIIAACRFVFVGCSFCKHRPVFSDKAVNAALPTPAPVRS